MIESFPFGCTDNDYLEDVDFSRFATTYAQLVTARIPSSGKVFFVGMHDTAPKLSTDPAKGTEIVRVIDDMLRGELSSCIVADSILLAFQLREECRLVVAVNEVDPVVIQRAAADWLDETRENLSREFLLVKQAYRDPETGLLNSAHLFSVLHSEAVGQEVVVVLVELPPRSRVLRDAFRNAKRAAAALVAFTDNRFLVHHLGQCVFALLVRQEGIASVEHFSSSLVHVLKKDDFYRVHIGSSSSPGLLSGRRSEDCLRTGDVVLDQAWTALQTARRRGPFSFCDFSLLANADQHPLRSPAPEILKVYRRRARGNDAFCLVKISLPEEVDDVPGIEDILNLPDSASILGVDGGCCIYLPGYAGAEGLECATMLLGKLREVPGMSDVYAGVSAFPFHGFTKTETLANVQKALLHAAFFGPGQAVLFDAVSLNISGDIYFSDGDLPRAVREYRRGLGCDPRDVNLLNSLGVAYALLNKGTLARSTFESVLEIDKVNHMALYNLGLGAQLRGDLNAALDCFEKAHAYCAANHEKADLCRDLKVQLGQLYCLTGNYSESLRYLEEWRREAGERQQGRIFRYLGQAYLGTGKPREAMSWLQRALRQNEFDHDMLSLLGTAIWQAREGDDIALSLCSKGVDLAPDNPRLRVRLARIQLHTGQYELALVNLGKCRGKSVDQVEVQLLKASVYQKLQQSGRVRYWAHKVLQKCEADSEPYHKAVVLLESIQ